MQIERSLNTTLFQLQQVLSGLSNEEYSRPLAVLSNASIGQHTRHIIEFLQTLKASYKTGVVNYDNRKRNTLLETTRDLAQSELQALMESMADDDREMLLIGSYSHDAAGEATVRTTYHREMVYNLEHAIHHMAMIRIGISQSTGQIVPADFGVAPATIRYKQSVL